MGGGHGKYLLTNGEQRIFHDRRRGNILVSELTFFHLRFLSYGSGEFYFFNSYD